MLVAVATTVGVTALLLFGADQAQAGDDVPGLDVAAAEAAAHKRYTARLSANDAAAEEWRAAHGTGRPDAPPATEPPPDPRGCPEGTQVWQRDRITELCATLCESDRDCAPEEGRCRLLDLNESSESAPILLVDELPAEEVEAIELDETKPAPPVRVCDPFWDVEGATDADVVAMIE